MSGSRNNRSKLVTQNGKHGTTGRREKKRQEAAAWRGGVREDREGGMGGCGVPHLHMYRVCR